MGRNRERGDGLPGREHVFSSEHLAPCCRRIRCPKRARLEGTIVDVDSANLRWMFVRDPVRRFPTRDQRRRPHRPHGRPSTSIRDSRLRQSLHLPCEWQRGDRWSPGRRGRSASTGGAGAQIARKGGGRGVPAIRCRPRGDCAARPVPSAARPSSHTVRRIPSRTTPSRPPAPDTFSKVRRRGLPSRAPGGVLVGAYRGRPLRLPESLRRGSLEEARDHPELEHGHRGRIAVS